MFKMFSWFKNLKLNQARKIKKNSNEPYVEIISEGIDEMGRLKFEFDWNKAFISNLYSNGYTGSSEEEIVQKWFQSITTSNLGKLSDFNDDEQYN